MIFTWGVELLVFWLLFLALYASGSYDRCLSLTGVVSSGLALVAHVAISAWDPRDLSGAEEGGADSDGGAGVPLYYSDVSNAFLSLHLGLLLDASLVPAGAAWSTTVHATVAYAVLAVMIIPALGLAFASAQGRTYLFLQRHALLGVWWPSLARIVACRAPDWGWALPVVLSVLFALHVARRDALAAGVGLVVVLGAGFIGLFAQGGAGDVVPWTPKFGLAVGVFILTGGAQVGWTVLAAMDWMRARRAAAGGAAGAGDGVGGGSGGGGDDDAAGGAVEAGGAGDDRGGEEDHTPSAPPQSSVEEAAARMREGVSGGVGEEARDEFTLMFHNLLTPSYPSDASARHRRLQRPAQGSSGGVMYTSLSDKVR